MDIEQLKLILDAASAAGDGARQVVFIWFALRFATLFVWAGVFSGGVLAAYKLIRMSIDYEYGDITPKGH